MSHYPLYSAARKSWGINGNHSGPVSRVFFFHPHMVLCNMQFLLFFADLTPDTLCWPPTALGSVIVEVEADDGTVGVGVSIGGDPACYIIENHLSRFVEGQDPR